MTISYELKKKHVNKEGEEAERTHFLVFCCSIVSEILGLV